jgi:recombination protein RecA
MYNEGISGVGSLLDLALEYDIMQKRGSWISYKGTQVAQGRDACKDALKADPTLYAEVEVAVKTKLNEKIVGKTKSAVAAAAAVASADSEE